MKPYISADGIRVAGADLPSGHHTVIVTVADEKGRVTSETVTVNIEEQ